MRKPPLQRKLSRTGHPSAGALTTEALRREPVFPMGCPGAESKGTEKIAFPRHLFLTLT